jgi:hypothetical protein
MNHKYLGVQPCVSGLFIGVVILAFGASRTVAEAASVTSLTNSAARPMWSTIATMPGHSIDSYNNRGYLISGPPVTRTRNLSVDSIGAASVLAFESDNDTIGSAAVGADVSPTPSPTPNPSLTPMQSGITIRSPVTPANVSGIATVSTIADPDVTRSDFYVDGSPVASTPLSTWDWDTTDYLDASHAIVAKAYSSSGKLLGSAATVVNVANGTGAIPPGATIAALTGSAAGIAGADTNPADYGNYTAPGGSGAGDGLIGGPLLTDKQAASFVVSTQKSTVETGTNGAANATANNYFNNIATTNPSDYLSQLQAGDGFWATAKQWGGVTARIDGACPMANPTTAEVLQWAANKWGINPLALYAEATDDGDWDATAIGDNGTSSGMCQVADRNNSSHPNHAWAGFSGAGSMLSRENSCFNADFYAAHLYAAFRGLTGECPGGDIGTAIQTWLVGRASAPGSWTDQTYSALTQRSWENRFFNGQPVPY